jgi:hypothetical protein
MSDKKNERRQQQMAKQVAIDLYCESISECKELKTSHEWYSDMPYHWICDPDGWRRTERDIRGEVTHWFSKKITSDDFLSRLNISSQTDENDNCWPYRRNLEEWKEMFDEQSHQKGTLDAGAASEKS